MLHPKGPRRPSGPMPPEIAKIYDGDAIKELMSSEAAKRIARGEPGHDTSPEEARRALQELSDQCAPAGLMQYINQPLEHYPIRELTEVACNDFLKVNRYYEDLFEERRRDLEETAIVAIQSGRLPGIESPPYGVTFRDFCLWLRSKFDVEDKKWQQQLFEWLESLGHEEHEPDTGRKVDPASLRLTWEETESALRLHFTGCGQKRTIDIRAGTIQHWGIRLLLENRVLTIQQYALNFLKDEKDLTPHEIFKRFKGCVDGLRRLLNQNGLPREIITLPSQSQMDKAKALLKVANVRHVDDIAHGHSVEYQDGREYNEQ